ncbi:HlyD family secretion protein [Devosia sp.]|uniref:HlyD family secretion protein n=1 Tax=Devosia sp. TaxID=1871048 RepID=UPI003BAD254B
MAQSENPKNADAKNVRPFPNAKAHAADAVVTPLNAEAVPLADPSLAPGKDSAVAPATKRKTSRRPLILAGVGIVALLAAGWVGTDWFFTGRFMVATDDAYIGGDIATISSKLSGYVATVNVVANQTVKAGDPLITLDDGDYRIARDQALAQIDTQNLTLKRIDAQVTGAEASLAQAKAQKLSLEAAQRNAALTQTRSAELTAKAVGTQAALDQANAALDQANANLVAGDAEIASAEAAIAVLKGQRAEAEGQLKTLGLARDKAERDLGFAVLRAPYDGVVGNLSVQAGDLVSAGTRLAALVPTTALYIDANFKETQLSRLAAGEKVIIKVDALDGAPITGTVESIAPASGSVFSLLPAENATGNFTKVVQRVPVRIALPADALASGKLRAGLSVTVEADTRTAPAAE